MSSPRDVSLPPKTDPRWTTLVTAGSSQPIRLLALKFMLTRMTQETKRDPSPGTIAKNINELSDFLGRNRDMVKIDVATLFG